MIWSLVHICEPDVYVGCFMDKNYQIFRDLPYSFTSFRERKLKELTRMIGLLELLLLDWTPSFAGPAIDVMVRSRTSPIQSLDIAVVCLIPKIRIYDVGMKKKAGVEEFSICLSCIWLVGEKENVSSEWGTWSCSYCMEQGRYMTKFAGKDDAFHLRGSLFTLSICFAYKQNVGSHVLELMASN